MLVSYKNVVAEKDALINDLNKTAADKDALVHENRGEVAGKIW